MSSLLLEDREKLPKIKSRKKSGPIYFNPHLKDSQYIRKIRYTFGNSLIALYPLWEASGGVIYDQSGKVHDGTYTAVTLGKEGIGDGKYSALFDGSTSYCNIYSANLGGAFNGAEGTAVGWVKASGAGVWTDATNDYYFRLQASADNDIYIRKDSTNNRLKWNYAAGGTFEVINKDSVSTTDWFHVAITWSKAANLVAAYYNGAVVSTSGTLGTWAGALAIALLGAQTTAPILAHSGYLYGWAFGNTALTAAAIDSLYRV